MVRLKGTGHKGADAPYSVSIPNGTIKRQHSLQADRNNDVSIPNGTIKRCLKPAQ